MKKMSIYEPAMCCDTGICGVSIDPELLRISTVINALQKNGVGVDRFNLSIAPMALKAFPSRKCQLGLGRSNRQERRRIYADHNVN